MASEYRGARAREFKPIDRMNHGELLQAGRITAGLTQEEVTSATGMKKATYSGWERSEVIRNGFKLALVINTIKELAKNKEENPYLNKLESFISDIHGVDFSNVSKNMSLPDDILKKRYIKEIISYLPDEEDGKILRFLLEQYKAVRDEKQQWLFQYLAKDPQDTKELGKNAQDDLEEEYANVIRWLDNYNKFMNAFDKSVLDS